MCQKKINNTGIVHLGISDHSLIYGCRKIALTKPPPKVVEIRNYKNYNLHAFKHDLTRSFSACNWAEKDPNILWEQSKTAFDQTSKIHAPTRLRKVRSEYALWLNEQIKKAMNNRDYFKKKAVKTKSNYYNQAYRTNRNHVNKLINNAKKTYYKTTIENNKANPKQMWKHINQLVSRVSKTTHIPTIKVGNKVIEDEEGIAETLNEYFFNVGPELSNQIAKSETEIDYYMKPVSVEFKFQDIPTGDVMNILSNLKESKSCGYDKISAKILKDSSEIIAPMLMSASFTDRL